MAQFQRIVPCLWFDSDAEEAVNFYMAIFDNAKILRMSHYTEEGRQFHGKEPGSVMTVVFTLAGQEFTAMNAGPHFKFTEAISLQVFCNTQEEIDHYWSRLTANGGQEQPCGWVKDRFGLSWQVSPLQLEQWTADPDPVKVSRVLGAMYKMRKLDIETLRRAYYGE